MIPYYKLPEIQVKLRLLEPMMALEEDISDTERISGVGVGEGRIGPGVVV